jgi:AAA domain
MANKAELQKRAYDLAKLLDCDPDEVMELAEVGFEEVDTTVYPRLIMSSSSKEKKGKTHFGIHTTPAPVALIDFDLGTEGVVNKKTSGRVIIHKQFNLAKRAALEDRKVKREEWEEEHHACLHTIRACVASPLIRTLVIDTGTEMWELARLAEFGKLEQVKSHHYGPLNREFREIIQSVYARKNLNAIFTHKVKKEYVDDKTTGKVERAGFGDMPFLVQCNIEHYKTTPDHELYDQDEGPQFGVRVINCRQNPEVDGRDDFIGKRCSFQWIGRTVFPDSKRGDWE